MEREWQKFERQLLQQLREAAEHSRVSQAMAEAQLLMSSMNMDPAKSIDVSSMMGGTATRPNAYVPNSEGSLPIPKPFGRHAPFKASDPAHNLRHLRRPEPAAENAPPHLHGTFASDLVD